MHTTTPNIRSLKKLIVVSSILTLTISSNVFAQQVQQPKPILFDELKAQEAVKKGIPGFDPAAYVVSEVTVTKVVDTKSMEKIKEQLKSVNPKLYSITEINKTETNLQVNTSGALPISVINSEKAITLPSRVDSAAMVVSEVTVTKVIDTKSLEQIKKNLKDLDENLYEIKGIKAEKVGG